MSTYIDTSGKESTLWEIAVKLHTMNLISSPLSLWNCLVRGNQYTITKSLVSGPMGRAGWEYMGFSSLTEQDSSSARYEAETKAIRIKHGLRR